MLERKFGAPHFLFGGPYQHLFFDSGWVGGFEVVKTLYPVTKLKTFISYSWDSNNHKELVCDLVEELRKNNIDVLWDQNDLLAGDEITSFMELGIGESIIRILICTDIYTLKANNRESGVGFETIISSNEYAHLSREDRARFIPIVRNNKRPKGKKLPTYLGSSLYIDMQGDDWRAEPMQQLLASINRHS